MTTLPPPPPSSDVEVAARWEVEASEERRANVEDGVRHTEEESVLGRDHS